MQTENKKLSVQAIRGAKKEQQDKPTADVNKIKEELVLMGLERDELRDKLKGFMEARALTGKIPGSDKKTSDVKLESKVSLIVTQLIQIINL